ncbi:MAG: STAS domain-containing protein [Candidatus Kapaibacterium sp.]
MPESAKLSIEREAKKGIDCLYLGGYLDAHTAPELESEISEIIEAGQNRILVNFRDLDYISSAGLGVFMAFIEDIRSRGGDIKLANMKPKVFSVFDLLGFPMLFDIETEEIHALEKFMNDENRKNEE